MAGLNPHAGDGGNFGREEIDVIDDLATAPTPAAPANYGWPCYEGVGRQGGYDAENKPGAAWDKYTPDC